MRVKLDRVYVGWKSGEIPLGPGVVNVDKELGEYLVEAFPWAHSVPSRSRRKGEAEGDQEKGDEG